MNIDKCDEIANDEEERERILNEFENNKVKLILKLKELQRNLLLYEYLFGNKNNIV